MDGHGMPKCFGVNDFGGTPSDSCQVVLPPMPPSSRKVPGGMRIASAMMWSSRAAGVQLGSNTNLRIVLPIGVV
eukprot:10352972-Prorocentrum_lima.AAC.1